MLHKISCFCAALALALVCGVPEGSAADQKYVGVTKCRTCHKKELIGDQYGEWKKGAHAKAFETLKSDKALEIAKEKGLSKPPHEADECLKCHATAHGLTKEQVAKKPLKISDSVQCESCHGPGNGYKSKKIMSDRDKAIAKGMWEPGKDEKICLACHNDESPTWDVAAGFDFEARKEEIAHPIPEDVKGKYLEVVKERRKSGGADDEDEEDEDE